MPNILSLEKCQFKPSGTTTVRMAKIRKKEKTDNTGANKEMKLLDHTYITSKNTNSYRHFR